MATIYLKVGAAGSGASVNDPANFATWFLNSGGAWNALNPATDDVVICPGTWERGNTSSVGYQYGTAANWLRVRIAEAGEFPGEDGTELRIRGGNSYNHIVWVRGYTVWTGQTLVVEHVGGDGFGYASFSGPALYECTVRCEGPAAGAGGRYPKLNRTNNTPAVVFRHLQIANGRNSGAGPGAMVSESGTRAVVELLEIELAENETYPSGYLLAGGANFDPAGVLEVRRCVVTGEDDENNHLITVGSQVTVDAFDASLMIGAAPTTGARLSDFGQYAVRGQGGPFGVIAGSPQGRVDYTLTAPPTLQGDDPLGVGVTGALFPSTQANQISERTPLRFQINEGTLHEAAAPRDIAFELLVNPTLDASADTRNVWLDVLYWPDGASAPVVETTRAAASGTALEASDATWSATTYAAQSLTRRRLALTTSQDVAVGTPVTVYVSWGVAGSVSSDFALFSGRTVVELAA